MQALTVGLAHTGSLKNTLRLPSSIGKHVQAGRFTTYWCDIFILRG